MGLYIYPKPRIEAKSSLAVFKTRDGTERRNRNSGTECVRYFGALQWGLITGGPDGLRSLNGTRKSLRCEVTEPRAIREPHESIYSAMTCPMPATPCIKKHSRKDAGKLVLISSLSSLKRFNLSH